MGLPKYTLRELLVAVAWISLGLALARFAFTPLPKDPKATGPDLWEGLRGTAIFVAGIALGTGVGCFFRRRIRGAVVGLVLTIFSLCVLLGTLANQNGPRRPSVRPPHFGSGSVHSPAVP